MPRVLLLICALLSVSISTLHAQVVDSIFALKRNGKWVLKHIAATGETPHMLALRYYVQDDQMEAINDFVVMKKLEEGNAIYIPVIPENRLSTQPPPLSSKNTHELFYRVTQNDEIGILSNYSGVTKNTIRKWNDLKGNTLVPGQVLFMGWIKRMDQDSTEPISLLAYPQPDRMTMVDTVAGPPVPGGLDTVYNMQTNNGLNVLNEKGTAVFFEKMGRSTMYYAFHNETVRGSIIKVFNPGTGKVIYAKVLGPLPDTKLYANSIIGISDNAKEALGIVENKAWCELSYAAN